MFLMFHQTKLHNRSKILKYPYILCLLRVGTVHLRPYLIMVFVLGV